MIVPTRERPRRWSPVGSWTRLVMRTTACLALVAGVSASEPPPRDLSKLIPDDAAALIYLPAPEAFEAELVALVSELSAVGAAKASITTWLTAMLGPAGASWDPSRPLAIAAAPPAEPGGMMPAVRVVVPTDDIDGALAAFPDSLTPPTSGSYLAFDMMPGVGAAMGNAPILEGPLGADVTIRLDIERIMETYGPILEPMLGMFSASMAMPDSTGATDPAAQMMTGLFDQVLGGLHASRRFDLTANLDGEASLGYALTVKPGTSQAEGPADPDDVRRVASFLPTDLPAAVWFAGRLQDWMTAGVSDQLVGVGEDAELSSLVGALETLYEGLGPVAGAGGFDESGFWTTTVSEPVMDVDEILGVFDELAASAVLSRAGVSFEQTGTSMLEGVSLNTWEIDVDFAMLAERAAAASANGTNGHAPDQMTDPALERRGRELMRAFFGDGLRISMGTVEGRLVMGLGSSAHLASTLRAARDGGLGAPPLAAALDRSVLAPNYVVHADLRALLTGVLERLPADAQADVPEMPAGGPIPATIWNGHTGVEYAGGLDLDVAGTVEIVKWFLAALPEPADRHVEEADPITVD